jgi:hypothetical protein
MSMALHFHLWLSSKNLWFNRAFCDLHECPTPTARHKGPEEGNCRDFFVDLFSGFFFQLDCRPQDQIERGMKLESLAEIGVGRVYSFLRPRCRFARNVFENASFVAFEIGNVSRL